MKMSEACMAINRISVTTILNSGQLIFKYVFSKLFQSKRLLNYDTYIES